MNITSTPKAIHADAAREFCEAIRTLATNDEALDNIESYLAYHFGAWLKKYASTPDCITEELKYFANMF